MVLGQLDLCSFHEVLHALQAGWTSDKGVIFGGEGVLCGRYPAEHTAGVGVSVDRNAEGQGIDYGRGAHDCRIASIRRNVHTT